MYPVRHYLDINFDRRPWMCVCVGGKEGDDKDGRRLRCVCGGGGGILADVICERSLNEMG